MKIPKSMLPLLHDAVEALSNRCCNDYDLPDTPENRAFVQAALDWNSSDGDTAHVYNGKIYTQDFLVLAYIAHLVEEQNE